MCHTFKKVGIIPKPNNNPPKLSAKITIVRVKTYYLFHHDLKVKQYFEGRSAFENQQTETTNFL